MKYTINNMANRRRRPYKQQKYNMQKRNYEEVNVVLKWGMLVLVTVVCIVCIVLYMALDVG